MIMNDDTISRHAAIDELVENKEIINAVLDSLTFDYNTRRGLEQRREQINDDIETIKELQSIDPVKHARWISDIGGFFCSNCNYHTDDDEIGNWDITFGKWVYCPHCGAKMDL